MTTQCSEAAGNYRKLCEHYSRGCSLVSPCCGKVYPCRFCHNENEATHELNRFAVSEVVCRNCNTRQPTVESCTKCGIKFGQYFCSICHLYDDADKGQYHCEKCGLCRVGGKNNYFHCDKCGLCLPISMETQHTCRAEASKANCPICMEDIHTSRHPAHIPRCGHLLHTHCFKSLQEAKRYQCPLCLRSLFDMNWAKLDEDILNTPLPYHLRNFMVQISCHDCLAKSDTSFHVIGLKCASCGSYNTVRCGHEELPVDNDPLPHNQRLVNEVLNPLLNRLFEDGNEGDEDDDDDEEGGEDDEEDYFDSDPNSEDFASAESDLGYLEHPLNNYLHGIYHSDTEDVGSNSSWVTEELEVIIGADNDTHLTSSWEEATNGGIHHDDTPST